jgi:hypothetical protein
MRAQIISIGDFAAQSRGNYWSRTVLLSYAVKTAEETFADASCLMDLARVAGEQSSIACQQSAGFV